MLSDYEAQRIEYLWKKLNHYRPINARKQAYFEAKNRIKDMKISIPPQLTGTQQAVGWPAVVVETLGSRAGTLEGFVDDQDLGLNEIYDDNSMGTQTRLAVIDALKFGIGYLMVGRGDTMLGEPEILVTAESPMNMVADYDQRKRRVRDAIQVVDYEDKITYGTYLNENGNISFVIANGNIMEEDTDDSRVEHNLGRVPVVQIINRPETGTWKGHSEISEPIISTTDSMMRTMLGVEINREFYSFPQRYILGADEDQFIRDGRQKTGMEVVMDKVTIIPRSEGEGGELPQVGQFNANSPAPYIELMRFYANLFSSYSGLPMHYFGFETTNPSSSEAMIASETRLVKQAENFNDTATRSFTELANLMILMRDGELPEGFRPAPSFRDPRTPTRAQTADEVLKLVSANIIKPNSSIVYKRLGLTRAEINTITAENNLVSATELISNLAKMNSASDAQQELDNAVEAEEGATE